MTNGKNCFIQTVKLPHVRGRVRYISDPKRQENLYAAYSNVDPKFWRYLSKENQADLDTMTVSQAEQFIKEGQFGKGSMLPKVQAAMRFVKKSGKPAIIAGLSHAAEAIEGLSGTRILPD